MSITNDTNSPSDTKPGLMARIKQWLSEPPPAPSQRTSKTGSTGPLRPLPEQRPLPCNVLFQILGEGGQTIGADVVGVVVVGRSEPESPLQQPDIDLTPHGAHRHGISRRHAILLPTDEGLCLIDLDSTNGTWINGTYLRPGHRYRLRSGDRVEFSSLKMVVRGVGEMQIGRGDDATLMIRRKPK